ncbi:hypothetical protein V493_07474 [Pseudogymnoascus sp. VKM F-4281 (FW-2241)]|nr:hypothetical protein V493_07474 [Pseudogymnoascus sp. VKM F-4281 (FW-2241)]
MSAGQYDDSNRAFLQAFMARGTLTFKEARPLLAAIFSVKDGEAVRPDEVTMADFDSYANAASAALSLFDYEIRSTVHQVSKERIWALVNTTSDALTQLATVRTADEIAFIKRVLDAMFETYNTERQEVMAITSMQAMKVAKTDERRRQSNGAGEESQSADKGLTHGQAEKLMLSMVEEGWFERSEAGWFTLSPRGLMELKSWLAATYNDPDAAAGEWQHIKNCEACKGIVTVGQRCSEVSCIVRLHEGCLVPFWRTRREEKCPKCKTPWKGLWVGEKAVTTTEAYNRGRRISGGGNRRPVEEDEEEEEVENGVDEEMEDDENGV